MHVEDWPVTDFDAVHELWVPDGGGGGGGGGIG